VRYNPQLGHTNLTHTERYTLHTDRHLKRAVELIEPEPKMSSVVTPDKRVRHTEDVEEKSNLQPIIVLRGIEKPYGMDKAKVLRGDYFSHFSACNEGRGPAVEIELALYIVY